MTGGAIPLHDPLREARHAIGGGRFREARNVLERLPEGVRASAEGQLLAAMTSWRLGDYDRSRTAALVARDRFRSLGDADGEMRAVNVAAAGAFALGELDEAERGFHRALALADGLADDLMTAHCANNLGNVAYFQLRHHVALGLYRLAGATFERLAGWPGLAMTWVNAAVVWTELDEIDKAREAAEHAIEIAERDRNRRLVGAALSARAEAVAAQDDLALAQAHADRALVLARGEGDRPGEAEALRVLCGIARRAGKADRATVLGREAVQVAVAVGDLWRQAEAHRELATLEEGLGRRDAARAALRRCAEAFERLGATARAARERERAAALADG